MKILDKFITFLKEWMLPVAISAGVVSYLIFYFTPALAPAGPFCHAVASKGQPVLIGIMIFLQMVVVPPKGLKLRNWHLKLLAIQTVSFVLFAALAFLLPEGEGRILAECAMLCFICPTAAAAGVVTRRIGGSLPDTISYLVLINCVATVLIPAIVPFVHPSEGVSFFSAMLAIAMRVFPILLLPGIAAWTIRYAFPALQAQLEKYSHLAFYVWGAGLYLAMVLSTRALVLSGLGLWAVLAIIAVSVACCFIQFFTGKRVGRTPDDPTGITSGQALGQKNTGFLIWLGYSYLTPVTSLAGGLYAIWQNLFNSWEIHEYQKATSSRKES